MPKKSDKPLSPLLINLFEGDADTLKQFYPALGHTVAVRSIIHNHCNKLRERASREGVLSDAGSSLEPDLTDILAGLAPSLPDE